MVFKWSRPDISYAVSTLAKYTTNPGMLHSKALLRVLGYLYATHEYCIKYARNGSVVDGIDARGFLEGYDHLLQWMALWMLAMQVM